MIYMYLTPEILKNVLLSIILPVQTEWLYIK